MSAIATETASTQGTLIGRAMELLGSGVPAETVASALGVTPGYISQLLSDKNFSSAVTQLKYDALSKHTERDASYDEIEDELQVKLKKSMSFMIRPADILAAIRVINGAKRRGTDSKESIIAQQNIVEITMPTQIVQQFTTNITNQVIKAGDQDLITIQSSELLKAVETPTPITEELSNPETKTVEMNSLLDSL